MQRYKIIELHFTELLAVSESIFIECKVASFNIHTHTQTPPAHANMHYDVNMYMHTHAHAYSRCTRDICTHTHTHTHTCTQCTDASCHTSPQASAKKSSHAHTTSCLRQKQRANVKKASSHHRVRGPSFVVSLRPMEIRTFEIQVEYL